MTQSGRRLLGAYKGLIDKIRFQRLVTQYPEQAARLHDLRTASKQADSALNSVRASLRKSGVEILGDAPAQELVAA